ncbi:hypothetical protein E1301_Tti024113 [Triplophysa tibetana]|uniref:Uncharacterized protein n=1 Tax=Triplophysa tibetana TaxID=1572043 RepID=A0A5A9MWL5_9TELE|nr:hypothetical protein E1301_Tti024113 [Triplophysa tibetana]
MRHLFLSSHVPLPGRPGSGAPNPRGPLEKDLEEETTVASAAAAEAALTDDNRERDAIGPDPSITLLGVYFSRSHPLHESVRQSDVVSRRYALSSILCIPQHSQINGALSCISKQVIQPSRSPPRGPSTARDAHYQPSNHPQEGQ